MQVNSLLKNAFYRVAEDTVVLDQGAGVLLGTLDGIVNAATTPTFLRRELTQPEYKPGFSSPTRWIYKMIAPHVSKMYHQRPIMDDSDIPREVERICLDYENSPVINEMNRTTAGAALYTSYGVEPLARWVSLIAVANDLSDGRPENFGWLIVPIAASLLYECGRQVVRRLASRKPSESEY